MVRLSRKHLKWFAILFIVLALVGIESYLQTVPPVTIVSSGSMQHSDNWQPGILNTGDISLVKKTANVSDIITYVQGRISGFSSFGEYGNVIIYKAPNGLLIIHRAILFLTWHNGNPVIRGITSEPWINITHNSITINDVGYAHRNLLIEVSKYRNVSGFITTGDYNLGTLGAGQIGNQNLYAAADQDGVLGFNDPPVNISQVFGKAVLDIPWFGLIKLSLIWSLGYEQPSPVPHGAYEGLIITLAVILTLVFLPYRRIIDSVRKTK